VGMAAPVRQAESASVFEEAWWTPWFLCGDYAKREKHRTEVTEATEGGLGWWPKNLGERPGFYSGITRTGKHRTEVAEATEEAMGLVS
jgi:hypothetical protein